jgi:hypothetical protein
MLHYMQKPARAPKAWKLQTIAERHISALKGLYLLAFGH